MGKSTRNSAFTPYLRPMKFEFCLPTRATVVPAAPEWFHEIKFDGYRLRLERDGARVRLITKGGYDWTKRYPWIVEAALKNRQSRFVVDGEAVILGVDGRSDFNALHSSKQNGEVQLCAFDVLAIGGEDLRRCPSRCARRTLSGCCAAGRMEFSSIRLRSARSARTCSARPATWGWKAWCQSAVIGLTAAAGRRTGSR